MSMRSSAPQPRSRNTPRGGSRTARMILMMSLCSGVSWDMVSERKMRGRSGDCWRDGAAEGGTDLPVKGIFSRNVVRGFWGVTSKLWMRVSSGRWSCNCVRRWSLVLWIRVGVCGCGTCPGDLGNLKERWDAAQCDVILRVAARNTSRKVRPTSR